MTATYIEPLTPVRGWLRTLGLVGQRVYVVGQGGLPTEAFVNADDAGDLAGTVIGISRVGGGVDTPFDRPLVQFDCWAPKAGAATVAAELAADLCTHLDQLTYRPVVLDELVLQGASIESNLPVPSTHPRHVVTADVTVKAR